MNEEWEQKMEELMDELSERLEDIAEDAVMNAAEDAMNGLLEERLDDAVFGALQHNLSEALNECLSGFEFVLKDGTLVHPRQQTKVLSPDGSKLLICYGGLKVDGTTLLVQTRLTCWESIAVYTDREAAIAALKQIQEGMEIGENLIRL